MRVSPVAAYGIWGMMDLKLCRWFLILEALQTITNSHNKKIFLKIGITGHLRNAVNPNSS